METFWFLTTIEQTALVAEYAAKYGWSFSLAFEMYEYIGQECMRIDLCI